MKKLILTSLVLLFAIGVHAQKTIKLRINHKMNGAPFAKNTEIVNNIGDKLNFNRVQYYLSNIRIVHDGGMETAARDTYLLVDASNPMDYNLGTYNINKVERIHFSIGVDEENNHKDILKIPSHHPLGPKTPSMFWGWASGYRFVALGGKSGENLNRIWEIHCLFDEYYYTVYLPTQATDQKGGALITLNADYGKALSNVKLAEGVLAHGELEEDVIVIKNFRDSVFTNIDGVLDIPKIEKERLLAYPNPSTGKITFDENVVRQVSSIKITNALGAVVKEWSPEASFDVSLETSGMYFVTYTMPDQSVQIQKIVVQKN